MTTPGPVTQGDMTWGEIRNAYLGCCRQSVAAQQEAWAHLTQGLRLVVQAADLPEVYQAEATVDVPADPLDATLFADYVELDCDVYHVDSIVNLTDGAPVFHEPSGMPGRDRYIDESTTTRGKPTDGQVRYFTRKGNRIYLRDTPTAATKLLVRFRAHPPVLTESDVAKHPITPPHLDWAIVYYSAHNFYSAHPQLNQSAEPGAQKPSAFYFSQAESSLIRPKQPEAEEEKTAYTAQRLAGFRASPRGWRR